MERLCGFTLLSSTVSTRLARFKNSDRCKLRWLKWNSDSFSKNLDYTLYICSRVAEIEWMELLYTDAKVVNRQIMRFEVFNWFIAACNCTTALVLLVQVVDVVAKFVGIVGVVVVFLPLFRKSSSAELIRGTCMEPFCTWVYWIHGLMFGGQQPLACAFSHIQTPSSTFIRPLFRSRFLSLFLWWFFLALVPVFVSSNAIWVKHPE